MNNTVKKKLDCGCIVIIYPESMRYLPCGYHIKLFELEEYVNSIVRSLLKKKDKKNDRTTPSIP